LAGRPVTVPSDVRAALRERSGGRCEIGLSGCWGWAVDPHHRVTVKRGGRHGPAKEISDRLSNLLDACRWCHELVTFPRWLRVYDLGLCLKEWKIPAQEPVRYRRDRLVYLDDAGAVLEYEAVGA
jgi:hypothetical protein